MKAKLAVIKEIIETSYTIGDYVDKYESYQQQMKSANLIQTITTMLIPEFKEFIAEKLQKITEEANKAEKPKTKNK